MRVHCESHAIALALSTSPINFSPDLYRLRNLVERFFKKMKQCRRIAPRYDKLAANYLAFIKLASIRLWIWAYESTPLGKDRRIDQRLAARAGSFGALPLWEGAAAGRAAHLRFLHHDLSARQGYHGIARELAALVGRVVAI